MVSQSLSQLLSVMEEQVQLMADLSALSHKKTDVLVASNLDELDILIRGEQALIWQMGKLEESRFRAQMEVSAQLGLHPSQLTLERLTAAVPPDLAARCQDVAGQYAEAVRDLADTNELNTELIHQAMAFVDFSLQLLGARGPASGRVYSGRGDRPQADHRLRRLDNRA